MNIYHYFLLSLGIIFTTCIRAQDDLSQQDSLPVSVSVEYVSKVSGKADGLNTKLDKQTTKALRQWQKQEDRIKRKLARTDSLKSASIFGNAEQKYKELEQRLQNSSLPKTYIASLDTLSTSLRFLEQNPQFLAGAKETQQKLKDAINKVDGMDGRFQKAEEIKKFMRERKELLKNELSKFGFAKELKKLSKQGYYYQQQIEEYKTLLTDHRKAERKALELLNKSSLFRNFLRRRSMLASLFRLPGDPNDPVSTASLAGLQTRASVNGLIQQQIAAGGPNAQEQFRQNLQAAQSQMNELKNKVNQLGNGTSDTEMPDGFIENRQRKKMFWKKWETGLNMQNNRANGIMPVSSDIGISAGFKPNNWFTAGGGFAGRIGWGKNIRHVSVSYSGISLRSFVEIRLKSKGSFQAVAAFEKNYRPEIRNIEQLKDKSGWQNAGLAGISKVISVKSKFFKKTKLSLLWDFLSYQETPKSQPVILRFGYTF